MPAKHELIWPLAKHELIWPLVDPSTASNYTPEGFSDGLLPHVHPARRVAAQRGFDSLVEELEVEVEAGNVKKASSKYADQQNADGDLHLYLYTRACESRNKWSETCIMSRGLVLDLERRVIVATPFFKFFNDSEDPISLKLALEFENIKVRVSEKMDGSLGIIFHHNGRWLVVTKGSFHSPQACWGTHYLNNHFDVSKLSKGTTYLGELIYAENTIVIPYAPERQGITWLAAYHESGREYTLQRLEQEVRAAALESTQFNFAGQANFESFSSLRAQVDALPWTSEGFVVYVETLGFRAKLKGPAYLEAHRSKDGANASAVWATLKGVLFNEEHVNGEGNMALDNLNEWEENLAEEHIVDYFTFKSEVVAAYAKVLIWLESIRKVLNESPEFGGISKKQLGKMCKQLQVLRRASDQKRTLDFKLLEQESRAKGKDSAEALLSATLDAWNTLWEFDVKEGERYPAPVGTMLGTDKVGLLLPEDSEMAQKVQQKLASSGSVPSKDHIPDESVHIFVSTMFLLCDGSGPLPEQELKIQYQRLKPKRR